MGERAWSLIRFRWKFIFLRKNSSPQFSGNTVFLDFWAATPLPLWLLFLSLFHWLSLRGPPIGRAFSHLYSGSAGRSVRLLWRGLIPLPTSSGLRTSNWVHPVVLSSGPVPWGHLLRHAPYTFHLHVLGNLPPEYRPPSPGRSGSSPVRLRSVERVSQMQTWPSYFALQSSPGPSLGPQALFPASPVAVSIPALWLWPHGPAGSSWTRGSVLCCVQWAHLGTLHPLAPSFFHLAGSYSLVGAG